MAIVVEDGTGKTTADAYISVADADTYNTAHAASVSWAQATTTEKEKAIRLATQYLDAKYRFLWRGARYNETQALAWPRSAFYDYDGFEIEAETVPAKLAQACAELAIRVIDGDFLFPDVSDPGLTSHSYANQSESESKTWAGGSRSRDAKVYPIVNLLLADLIHSGPTVERG